MDKVTRGMIEVICGPMFAGKTTALISQIKKYTIAKKKCLVVSPAKDNRYTREDFIVSHDQVKSEAIKVDNLKQIEELYANYDVIFIDEGHFFHDISSKADHYANNGKTVIISVLDGDFRRNTFNDVGNLLSKCEKIKKLKAICVHCGQDAAFTVRITLIEDIEVIGGSDTYEPVCRFHHLQHEKRKGQESGMKSH